MVWVREASADLSIFGKLSFNKPCRLTACVGPALRRGTSSSSTLPLMCAGGKALALASPDGACGRCDSLPKNTSFREQLPLYGGSGRTASPQVVRLAAQIGAIAKPEKTD